MKTKENYYKISYPILLKSTEIKNSLRIIIQFEWINKHKNKSDSSTIHWLEKHNNSRFYVQKLLKLCFFFRNYLQDCHLWHEQKREFIQLNTYGLIGNIFRICSNQFVNLIAFDRPTWKCVLNMATRANFFRNSNQSWLKKNANESSEFD